MDAAIFFNLTFSLFGVAILEERVLTTLPPHGFY